VAKTHRGVQRLFAQLAKNDPRLRDLPQFLSQAYNLKDSADYELTPTRVTVERAGAAIETAERFIERITEVLA
jgi:uncharacterized protein (UPF0332 family)